MISQPNQTVPQLQSVIVALALALHCRSVGGFTRETWSSAALDQTVILGWKHKHPCIRHACSAHQTDGIRGSPCCFSTLKLLRKFSSLTAVISSTSTAYSRTVSPSCPLFTWCPLAVLSCTSISFTSPRLRCSTQLFWQPLCPTLTMEQGQHKAYTYF
jgi:hypothetical protein